MTLMRLFLLNLSLRWREWWAPQAPDLIRRARQVWQADVVRTREGR